LSDIVRAQEDFLAEYIGKLVLIPPTPQK